MFASSSIAYKRVFSSFAMVALTALALPAAAQSAADIESGTLKFALSPEPPFLLTAINTTLQMGMVTSKVMESLLYLDSDLKPQPLLAEKWNISPDGLTYTFKLRPNVKWHDGQPFTSADVSYTILEVLKKYILAAAPPLQRSPVLRHQILSPPSSNSANPHLLC